MKKIVLHATLALFYLFGSTTSISAMVNLQKPDASPLGELKKEFEEYTKEISEFTNTTANLMGVKI